MGKGRPAGIDASGVGDAFANSGQAGRLEGKQQRSVRRQRAERTPQPGLLLFRRADSCFAPCAAAPSNRHLWGTFPRGRLWAKPRARNDTAGEALA